MVSLIKWFASLNLAAGMALAMPSYAEGTAILNVSYDASREFYHDYNLAFSRFWQAKTSQTVTIQQSHGAASLQVRKVLDGLEADVVTMNQQTDIELLAASGLVDSNWRHRLPYNSAPYASTIVFLVRKGNPKAIHDWDDLARPNLQVIVPHPKTSGTGRYSYLAAWGYAQRKYGSEPQAQDFVARLFGNAPILNTGSRAATLTFIQRNIGDVLLTFESEVLLITREFNAADFEVVTPSVSILAEAPVAVVDAVVDKKGTRQVAEAYLDYLFSPEAQRIAAVHYFRPQLPAIAAEYAERFAPLDLFTVDELFGGWQRAQQTHFADGGTFDRIYSPGG